jgi:formylglycine-generating enzyme required for sulfatase activity
MGRRRLARELPRRTHRWIGVEDNRADCVVRGGSWFDYSSSSRSAYRYWYEPGLRNDNVGFRVARTLD